MWVSFKQMSAYKYKTKAFPAKLSLLSSHMVCLLRYSLLQEALMATVQDMFLFTGRYFTKGSYTENNTMKHIKTLLNDEMFILNKQQDLEKTHTSFDFNKCLQHIRYLCMIFCILGLLLILFLNNLFLFQYFSIPQWNTCWNTQRKMNRSNLKTLAWAESLTKCILLVTRIW